MQDPELIALLGQQSLAHDPATGEDLQTIVARMYGMPTAVVEKARAEGKKELVALRASICLVKFQQRPDAAAKIAEFKALSYGAKDEAIRKFVAQEGLATMLGEDTPVAGAVDKCADAIKRVSS